MKLLKLKDNSTNDINVEQVIPKLSDKVLNKTLQQLQSEGVFVFSDQLKDSEDIDDQHILLKKVNNKYYTSNIMGYLGLDDERMIIESRFNAGSHDYFLLYMLEKVLNIPNFIALDISFEQGVNELNLLMYLFPYYLKKAMHKGLYKTYITNHYNDNNVRGKVNINEHIKLNSPFIGRVAYTKREFSFDNDLNQLLRHTIEYIKSKPQGNMILSKSKEEVNALILATSNYHYQHRQKIIHTNKNNLIKHAYFFEYLQLQKLCLMILQYEKHHIKASKQPLHGVLFDGAWLWEEYINILIKDKYYHPQNKVGKDKQYLFDKSIGSIYPDFISKDQDNPTIIDAKYKPINNINGKDYLQLLAYMYRFDAKQGYYLYPEVDAKELKCLRLNSGTSYENNVRAREEIKCFKLGLKIPCNATSYQAFVEAISREEINLVDQINNNIKP